MDTPALIVCLCSFSTPLLLNTPVTCSEATGKRRALPIFEPGPPVRSLRARHPLPALLGQPKGVYFSHRQLVLYPLSTRAALAAIGHGWFNDKTSVGRLDKKVLRERYAQ